MGRIRNDERIEVLASVWLFERCSQRELHELAAITTPLVVEPGRVLAREGEPGSAFVVVVEGEAEVTSGGRTLATVGSGSFFGELALLDDGPRTASVTARTEMLVLVMNRHEFDELVDRALPSVARKMLTVLAGRLRDADARLADLGADSMLGRRLVGASHAC
jgi:CRP/FNR family transcriptional regulator, cyclic AMP receptor protein